MTDRYLSPAEAAEILGVTSATLEKWRGRRTGPPYCRPTRNVIRYRESKLFAWMDESEIESTNVGPVRARVIR